MASNRHLGRIIALQTLYEQELRQEAGDTTFQMDEVLERNIRRYKEILSDVAFIKQLVAGINKHAIELDATLQPVAPEWPIDQIARMDRLVLRIGLYELQNEADVPPKVVINGVLGTLLRQQEEAAATKPKAKAKPKAKQSPKKK